MSRDDRDKRGGHTRRKFGTYSCQCCPILRPRTQAQNRTERNRALDRYEHLAEGDR